MFLLFLWMYMCKTTFHFIKGGEETMRLHMNSRGIYKDYLLR